jgi:hypothetical protein
MEEVLKKNNWRVCYKCSCGGTTEVRLDNRRFLGVKIYLRPTQKKWLVKQYNKDIAHGKDSDFNAKMIEYGYIIAEVPNTGTQSS